MGGLSFISFLRGENFPGGQINYTQKTELEAIKGIHKGTGRFEVNSGLLASAVPTTWAARLDGKGGDWGKKISIGTGVRGIETLYLNGHIKIPDSESLAGQHVAGTLRISVTYPMRVSGGFLDTTSDQTIQLSFLLRAPGQLDKSVYQAGRGWRLFVLLMLAIVGFFCAGIAWATLGKWLAGTSE